MGKSARSLHPPYLPPPPPPQPPPRLPPASEAVIAPGGAICATWNLRGVRGTEIEIENVGSTPCKFEGYESREAARKGIEKGEGFLLHAGQRVKYEPRAGAHQFVLAIWSTEGAKVHLRVTAGRPARLVLALKKEVMRDPTTKLITGIVQSRCWVEEAP